jgi:hypothetical protein
VVLFEAGDLRLREGRGTVVICCGLSLRRICCCCWGCCTSFKLFPVYESIKRRELLVSSLVINVIKIPRHTGLLLLDLPCAITTYPFVSSNQTTIKVCCSSRRTATELMFCRQQHSPLPSDAMKITPPHQDRAVNRPSPPSNRTHLLPDLHL